MSKLTVLHYHVHLMWKYKRQQCIKKSELITVYIFHSPLLQLICGRNSYQSPRMVCSCTACSWIPVAGTMTTWWLRMRYLEWWTPCCRWCTLSHSRTMCLSLTSTMLLCTRHQPELELCPPQVLTGLDCNLYFYILMHLADTFDTEWAGRG